MSTCFDTGALETELSTVRAERPARSKRFRAAAPFLFCGAAMLGMACALGASAQPAPGAPPGPRAPEVVAPTVPIDLAVEAARAAVVSCAGFHVAITVLDQAGFVKLAYLADGVAGPHTHTSDRKARTALLIKAPSEQLTASSAADKAIADKVAADKDSYMAVGGGIPIVVNGQVIGSIGVSGGMPATKDKSCATDGLAAIQARLH